MHNISFHAPSRDFGPGCPTGPKSFHGPDLLQTAIDETRCPLLHLLPVISSFKSRSIHQYLANSTQVPDYLWDQAQSLEKARQDLLKLEGQRAGLQMHGAQHEANAEPIPDSEYELARSIEESRQEILKSVGLTD